MRLTWYGHASFLIEDKGLRIVTDPFSPVSGYDPIDESADIVTLSQDDDRFHSHVASITGEPTVVNFRTLPAKGVETHGIRFQAVSVWEDVNRSKNPNGMFHFTVDGIRLAHMGDLGHPLSDAEIEPIRGTDVLFALAGGNHTIALDALVDAIERIRPRLVIPMHYQVGKVKLDILPLSEMLALIPSIPVTWHDSPTIELIASQLPAPTQVLVLKHAR
ncbi:MAG TPA: MBL fold metallo-hydrolase [Chloroflexota bacterium]|nr:MBL fold metallo-hydrolase [Chloroflexota bacterium]